MAIYMRIPGISGAVTTADYLNCIALTQIGFNAGRTVNTRIGSAAPRVWSSASASEMAIVKPIDCASPYLFTQACVGKALPEVTLDLCNTAGQPSPYKRYTLQDVLVSGYHLHAETGDYPLEMLTLNFTGMEQRYIPYTANHAMGTPISVHSGVHAKASLHKQLCQSITDLSPDGFNLFVAVVYGEVGGVITAREAVWKAVGSVIVNRVKTGIWRHWKTISEVIEHTGFDAYMDVRHVNWDHLNSHNPHIRSHQQFLKAWASLHNQTINYQDALLQNEVDTLSLIRKVLQDIYYRHIVTTQANYY